MSERSGSAYLFLSDLHLASGFNPEQGSFSPHESFFYDEQFARWLSAMQRQALSEGRQLHLVLLGDVFDFLRTADPQTSPQASTEAVLRKLERIAAGHSHFFEALGSLIEAGGELEIMPGNHDIELIYPAAQQKVVELIMQTSLCSPQAASRVHFHPWVYYLPGVFYAEHGQQLHWINCFPDLPARLGEQPERIQLPVGSQVERYLLSPRQVGDRLRLGWALLCSLARGSSPWLSSRHRSGLQLVLTSLSAQVGLSPQTLDSLVQLWPAFDLAHMLAFLRTRGRGTNYLVQAARTIHQLLMCRDEQVPYYIFGHTHQPARLSIASEAPEAVYLNAGSWGDENPGPAAKHQLFRFTYLTHTPGGLRPEARLLTWNDSSRQVEPLRSEAVG